MPYMPPELLAHSQLTPQADVYSFGIVMWEVYTGQVARPPCSCSSTAGTLCRQPCMPAHAACKEPHVSVPACHGPSRLHSIGCCLPGHAALFTLCRLKYSPTRLHAESPARRAAALCSAGACPLLQAQAAGAHMGSHPPLLLRRCRSPTSPSARCSSRSCTTTCARRWSPSPRPWSCLPRSAPRWRPTGRCCSAAGRPRSRSGRSLSRCVVGWTTRPACLIA